MDATCPPRPSNAPELLAPAGSWECIRAAVANGADAVYFGLPQLNARIRADNFTLAELPAIMEWLHARNRTGFLTLNTLVFPTELPLVDSFLQAAAKAGVDAVIVQDPGVARLLVERHPSLALHASTQMTISSVEGVEWARQLGASRVVLARELSLREIATITRAAILPVEVFVHGALCVAYSGQCLTSEALGQRSANRGECAQACRMPYELIVDGTPTPLDERRYLLSPQDLAGLPVIPDLVRLGVASFKIEGRLKSPEYVAAVTAAYRKAIDAACANQPHQTDPADQYALDMTFSRGLYTGWFHGVHHQELVHARYGKKRGPLLGRILRAGPRWIELDHPPAVRPGDGIVVANPTDTENEIGGTVWRIDGHRLHFDPQRTNFTHAPPGAEVYKTSDPALARQLRKTFAKDPPVKRHPITITASGSDGTPLTLTVHLQNQTIATQSTVPLQKALRQPLRPDTLQAQLDRLGNTRWELRSLHWQVDHGLILPLKEINRMRRLLVEALDATAPLHPTHQDPPTQQPPEDPPLSRWLASYQTTSPPPPTPTLSVLCRSLEQMEALLQNGPPLHRLLLDFEDLRRFPDAVARFRALHHGPTTLWLATPRIQKSGETGFFRLIERAAPDGVLVRNPGGLIYFRSTSLPFLADFSLNAANPIAVQLLHRAGARTVTLSFDLVVDEVEALLAVGGAALPVEIVLHQHMPMFHMEHCVFAAFLSNGKDYTDCGRPCERHQVTLRDRVGMEHPLLADVGCRNTLHNAVPQSAALFLDRLLTAGVRAFRIDLLRESGTEAVRLTQLYHDLVHRRQSPESVWQALRARSQFGVTRGTLEARTTATP